MLRIYKCGGLSDNKLWRVLTKLRKEVELGGIAMLQETQIFEDFFNLLENEHCE
jgi:hypothetical protein